MAGKGNSNDVNLRRLENGNKDDHKGEGSRDWECGNMGGRDNGNVLSAAEEPVRT